MKAMRFILTVSLVLSCLILKANEVNGNTDRNGIGKDDIFGLVKDATTEKPLKDVTVTAILLSKREKVIITNPNGEYGIEDLKPGIYKLIFEKNGFKKVVKDKVAVKANTSIQVNVEMEGETFDLSPSPFHFMDL